MWANTKSEEFKKRLYRLTLEVINFIEELPKDRVVEVISKQLLRSATSICANYIEAYAASSKRDYINYFNHSLKSANESKFWISLLKDTNKAKSLDALNLLKEVDEISKILASSIITMRKRTK